MIRVKLKQFGFVLAARFKNKRAAGREATSDRQIDRLGRFARDIVITFRAVPDCSRKSSGIFSTSARAEISSIETDSSAIRISGLSNIARIMAIR
ncbi:MAG: hypothetical protein ABI700_09005 [Chloroflexota bacterium]